MANERRKIVHLPAGFGSLNSGLPPAPPGMIFVLGPYGGRGMTSDAGSELVFGRNEEVVHVIIGGTDTTVSRRQGVITHTGSGWMLENIGKRPIQLRGRQLLRGHQAEVPSGYVPLIIMSPHQEHVLEIRTAAPLPPPPTSDPSTAETYDPDVRELEAIEKLVLVCLAQQYLNNDPHAQPLTWEQVAAEISELRPSEKWDWRKPHRIVTHVREKLRDQYHVPGLWADEIFQPSGDAIKHNLITDLLITGTLYPEDLHMLDG